MLSWLVLRDWSLFMGRGEGGKWEGDKRSFTLINRGGIKKVLTQGKRG
jgi:hypothetical protein